MQSVRAKKQFGQHFLKDPLVAKRIADLLTLHGDYRKVIEIGPGMGILTSFLLERKEFELIMIEIDKEAISYLTNHFPDHADQIIEGDFLEIDLQSQLSGPTAIIGNFPYNISSQILFKVLEHRTMVPEVVGMFQKEVATRIASPPGNRDYGILSVFMQAYYNVELVFTLDENAFEPPPKVKSAVLHFIRKENFTLGCDEKKFRLVVKTAFNQRRKTLRNALSPLTGQKNNLVIPYSEKRAESLTWQQFVELTNLIFPEND